MLRQTDGLQLRQFALFIAHQIDQMKLAVTRKLIRKSSDSKLTAPTHKPDISGRRISLQAGLLRNWRSAIKLRDSRWLANATMREIIATYDKVKR